jgi:hypothetical protein
MGLFDCPHCGRTISATADRCVYCGRGLSTEAEPAGTAPAAVEPLPSSEDLIRTAHDTVTSRPTAETADEHPPLQGSEDPLAPYRPDVPVEPTLRDPVPPKPGWWESRWVRIAAGVAIFGAISLWNSGVFDQPAEEVFLEAFGADVRADGVSEAAWDCIEQNLRDEGYVAEIGGVADEWEEDTFGDFAFGYALTDLPPEAQHFIDGYFRFAFDPDEGCLSPQDFDALGQAGPEPGDPMTIGSDATLDMLHDGCEGGSWADCDMMWLISPLGSEYEAAAEVCGGHTEFVDFDESTCMYHYDDFSELDTLESQCGDGFFPACDVLSIGAIVGSTQEEFGLTCGGRRDPNLTTLCWLAFGLGTRN